VSLIGYVLHSSRIFANSISEAPVISTCLFLAVRRRASSSSVGVQCSSRRCVDVQLGVRRRRVNCVSQRGDVLRRSRCDANSRPASTDFCRHPGCQPVWVVTRWSQVTAPHVTCLFIIDRTTRPMFVNTHALNNELTAIILLSLFFFLTFKQSFTLIFLQYFDAAC